ncbi:Ig-like domain-containing protein [soil metagenome]
MKIFKATFFILIVVISSCANRVTPSGGKKDVTPPKLLTTTPANLSTDLRGGDIELKFDEYIVLDDLQNQLVISPIMDPKPDIKAFKKTVFIKLPKNLEANTTYTLNFGKAIKDLREGNPFDAYQYVFSTGSFLDSLLSRGKVLDAATMEPAKGLTVSLYRDSGNVNADSLIFKRKPQYFTKSNELGEFQIGNIAAGKYKIFALDDKNSNYICDNISEEAIAFMAGSLVMPVDSGLLLKTSIQDGNMVYLRKVYRMNKVTVLFQFNKSVENLSLTELRSGNEWKGDYRWTQSMDSLYLFMPDTLTDSLNLIVSDGKFLKDTVMQFMGVIKESRSKPLPPPSYSIIENPGSSGPDSSLIFEFSRSVTLVNSELQISEDSVQLKDISLNYDAVSKRQLKVTYKWKPGSTYKVLLLPGQVRDAYGITNDSILNNFKVPTNENTAIVSVKVSGIKSSSPYLLQICTSKFEIVRQIIIQENGEYLFSYVPAGIYRIRLVEDENKNGKWDRGILGTMTQPEKVYVSAGNVQLRANWELETDITAE